MRSYWLVGWWSAIFFLLQYALPMAIAQNAIQGTVTDTQGQPVPDATVRVFASRPCEGIATTIPIMHPDCAIFVVTDSAGRFKIAKSELSDGNEVVLVAGKKDFIISRTNYVTPDEEDISLTLRSIKECGRQSSIKGKVVDSRGLPIQNAVIGFDDGALQPDRLWQQSTIQYVIDGQIVTETTPGEFASLSNDEGEFELPSLQQYFIYLSAVVPGVGYRDLQLPRSWSGPSFQWVVQAGFTVDGRIIDRDGPVKDYLVCVSDASDSYGGRRCLIAATRDDGTFVIEGIPTTNRFGEPPEYCLFGDIKQQNPRGHLETKRFDGANSDQSIDFGDLQLGSVTNLKIKYLIEQGPINNPLARLVLKLPHVSRIIQMTLPADGVIALENIPREVMSFNIYAGQDYSYDRSNPFQPLPDGNGFYYRPGDEAEIEVRLKRNDNSQKPSK